MGTKALSSENLLVLSAGHEAAKSISEICSTCPTKYTTPSPDTSTSDALHCGIMTSSSIELCKLCKEAGISIRQVLDQRDMDDSRPWIIFNPDEYQQAQGVKAEFSKVSYELLQNIRRC